jgi:hypothetical protein
MTLEEISRELQAMAIQSYRHQEILATKVGCG